jgi:hypothetical protein
MAKSEYDDEFESLGVDEVSKRVAASIWADAKNRAARTWLSGREMRLSRKQSVTKTMAEIAAIIIGICAVATLIINFLLR